MARQQESAKSPKGKTPVSMWEFLSKPIGFNSILDMLNKELDFDKHESESHVIPNLDRQADELIEAASRLAEKEGIGIEKALERYGIVVDAGSPAPNGDAAGLKSNMLASLDWQVSPAQEDSSSPAIDRQWVRRGDEAREQLRAVLGNLADDQLTPMLSRILPTDGELRERLLFLKFCTLDEFAQAERRFRQTGGQFWRWLLENETRDVKLFAAAIQATPYGPLTFPGKGSFVEWLLDKGHLAYSVYKQARQLAESRGQNLVRALSEPAALGPDRYLKMASQFTGIPALPKTPPKIPAKAADLIDARWAELFSIVPTGLKKDEMEVGLGAFPQPLLLERLQAETGRTIVPRLLAPADFDQFKAAFLEKPRTKSAAPASRIESSQRIHQVVASASAVNLVRQLFEGAMESRATDIHIEPYDDKWRVRFRIDGMLYDVVKMEIELASEVISRIKILADLDITEKRRPQDGHLRVTIHSQEYDMRIATLPTRNGEKIAIRLVYSGRVMKKLSELGLREADYEKVGRFGTLPHGMVLATGPVGSGKTTTLYSIINEINRSIYNVMSIEDPAEFELSGANQVEVNYKLQFGFVEGLRAILRQDPDTILIGEIRDEETARIAVRASMTGLLVFSTLHTNDAPGAVTALYNFHLPTHLISNSLAGVIAQRLLRRVCPHCKTSYKPSPGEIFSVGFTASEAQGIKSFHKGKGCRHCFNTGYLDRVGVFEVMQITPGLRDMILEQRPEKAIREAAIQEGMWTLSMDGRDKILKGETTSEEFLRKLRF